MFIAADDFECMIVPFCSNSLIQHHLGISLTENAVFHPLRLQLVGQTVFFRIVSCLVSDSKRDLDTQFTNIRFDQSASSSVSCCFTMAGAHCQRLGLRSSFRCEERGRCFWENGSFKLHHSHDRPVRTVTCARILQMPDQTKSRFSPFVNVLHPGTRHTRLGD